MTTPPVRNSRDVDARFSRRSWLAGAGAVLAAVTGAGWLHRWAQTRASVFVARGQRYDGSLVGTIVAGLLATGLDPTRLRGQSVLLKPNMVEPLRTSPHMTTHPTVVLAVSEVFRRWGAVVTVGEAPGHIRDTESALYESRLGDALQSERIAFADLNYESSRWQPNRGRRTRLPGFWFPESVLTADLIVSLPKLKTHHWVGMTAALKNMYGTLPGLRYGWPKNVLHHAGIPESVVDINASLPRTITVVDAIDCMEGDGPILGSPKPLGALVMGCNLMAVDATCARMIGLNPERITYLASGEGRLGTVAESRIEQRGERWQDLATSFEILDYPHLTRLRDHSAAVRSS